MGWTYTNRLKSQSIRAFFDAELTYDGKSGILDCAVVNRRTAYIAYKHPRDGHVFGIVCLLDYRPKDYYNFGYKDMDESMGPNESECPARILKLLSPTDSEYALEWRKRCQENLDKRAKAPKVKVGDTIVFKLPVTFRDGLKENVFIVTDPKSSVFIGYSGGRFRIPNWKKYEFSVLTQTVSKGV